jgi:hypothetical protein
VIGYRARNRPIGPDVGLHSRSPTNYSRSI